MGSPTGGSSQLCSRLHVAELVVLQRKREPLAQLFVQGLQLRRASVQ
jgi:hypothetical protein